MSVVEAGDYGLEEQGISLPMWWCVARLSCCGDEESHQTHGRAIGSGPGETRNAHSKRRWLIRKEGD